MLETITALDTALFLILNRDIALPFLDPFFIFITTSRNWIIPAVVMAVFFIRAERKNALIAIGLAIVVFAITDPVAYRIIKPWVGRLRPCNPDELVEGGRFLLGHKRSFSFPSNHAANWFGLATIFTWLYPRKWMWFFCIAFLVGYSRIHTGVHYPLDVAGGAVLGIMAGTFVFAAYLFFIRKKVSALTHAPSAQSSPPLPRPDEHHRKDDALP